MEDIIRLLPDSIANQIAAGEVVQRPASAVKELLENSLDAGAKSVRLIMKEAGKSLIQVIDDGRGMSHTDARMSFERHATSKIRAAEDLFRIRSMGFRGEALASIAAVAQVEMKTRREDDELGTLLHIEASEVKLQEPVQAAAGTSVCVKNLFYNIPARRNFLKSNPVELRHIIDEFHRVALANPEVRFSLHHNDQEVYQLDAGKLGKRIVQLFGKNYQHQLIPCEEEASGMRVTGYTGKPEFARKTRGEQFFFVNGRFIKSGYLHHAVQRAYEGMLQEDFSPFYALFIEMDPRHVDINVHPTKTEVKFEDDRLLYGIISSAVRHALASFNVAPSLDFDTDVNFAQFIPPRDDNRPNLSEKRYGEFKTLKDQSNSKNWEMIFQSADREEGKERQRAILETENEEKLTFSSRVPTTGFAEHKEKPKSTLQIHGRYLARQVRSGIVLVDQCAAHERILFERYQSRSRGQSGVSQASLFPQHIELNPADMALVMEIQPEIRMLGFDIELFGKNSVALNGIPPE
ncbi:MAG: DNA mismatch repair endonuclease MutL, partial [Cyclobacteriaceae bacterium]|nr:DNA mismatch repair endonuclease MutL [Cyclobacteriaceae bacterium]